MLRYFHSTVIFLKFSIDYCSAKKPTQTHFTISNRVEDFRFRLFFGHSEPLYSALHCYKWGIKFANNLFHCEIIELRLSLSQLIFRYLIRVQFVLNNEQILSGIYCFVSSASIRRSKRLIQRIKMHRQKHHVIDYRCRSINDTRHNETQTDSLTQSPSKMHHARMH